MAAADTPTLYLYNTLTRRNEIFTPLEPGKIRMYVCGPTVYDHAHLGHARCYITWDVLYRFLQFSGYDVTYARNVTDVDDKILNRAKTENTTPQAIAKTYYQSFLEDMDALNVLRPNVEPKATEYIAEMQQGIQAMLDKGYAYVAKDGSVYYRVSKKANYGILSKKPLDDLQAGARVEVDPDKENPLDFALWKGVSADDLNGWESPWPEAGKEKGWGRPGWHMECSAMNHGIFGGQIDLHAGGADLIFPHHENEIAQSEAWYGLAGGDDDAHCNQRFAKYWLHNGFVNVSGEKMSKSLGNFSTIKKVLERYDANTIRYFLLTHHYSKPVDFNEEALEGAKNRICFVGRVIKRLLKFADKNVQWLSQLSATSVICLPEIDAVGTSVVFVDQNNQRSQTNRYDIAESLEGSVRNFVISLSDNLNTPKALVEFDRLIDSISFDLSLIRPDDTWGSLGSITRAQIEKKLERFSTIASCLGFSLKIFDAPQELSDELLEEINQRIEDRKNAKAARDFATADKIRDELKARGIVLMDNKDGTTTWELQS